MDEEEFRRFVNMMLWLVIDEAEPLAEFGEASVDHVEGRVVQWGPWPRSDCALVLRRWLDAGLLVISGLEGAYSHSMACELLASPDEWRPGTSPSTPFVAATKLGAATPDEEWLGALGPLWRRTSLGPG